MIDAKIAGALILFVPILILIWGLLWKRQRPVFWFALAASIVGIGYLAATGATDDIARKMIPEMVASEI